MNDWKQVVDDLAYVDGKPSNKGKIKAVPADFFVKEILPFEPEGEGEHAFLWIEKKNTNTEFLARQLAKLAGVPQKDIGYAGLKDRLAVTQQWFSVRLAGKAEPDWHLLENEEIRLLKQTHHRKKLKRGVLKENFFRLRLTEFSGNREDVEQRLTRIKQCGLPNYFMSQRFGFDGHNLTKAEALFRGELKRLKRHQRGLYLSAARSHLFNLVLSERVVQHTWDKALATDVMIMQGSHSVFQATDVDEALGRRVDQLDVHPTAMLWGRGREKVIPDIIQAYEPWIEGLAKMGMSQDRRALRSVVKELAWDWSDNHVLALSFKLTAGAYATAVIREIMQ